MKKILILLLILLTTGCYNTKIPDDLILKLKKDEVLVYDDIYLYDLIGETNAEVLSENKLIKTDEIGDFSKTIKLNYKDKKYKYKIDYKVVDKTSPVFISAASYMNVLKNDDVYPCENAVYGDNYDKEVECEIEGDLDLTTIGTYKVKYVLSDSSKNKTEKNLTINVINEYPKKNNKNKNKKNKKVNLLFTDVIKKHKSDHTMIGIDVSKWQQDIDFKKVKEAGCEFVIMRLGVNTDIDKDISIDTYYLNNIKKAKEAGLKVGVYIYTTAVNEKMAKEHASWVINTLNGEKLDFPIAFDWENWSKFKNYKISIHDLDETFNTFALEIQKAGYDSMLYSSKFYLENVWQNKKERPVWLAHYTNKTNYDGKYILWQMSNVGKIDGIKGDVDIDIFYQKR